MLVGLEPCGVMASECGSASGGLVTRWVKPRGMNVD